MTDETKTTETVEASRRDFLKKAGKLAVYAPPAMLVMSKPSFATGWKKSGGITYPQKKKTSKKSAKKKSKSSSYGRDRWDD